MKVLAGGEFLGRVQRFRWDRSRRKRRRVADFCLWAVCGGFFFLFNFILLHQTTQKKPCFSLRRQKQVRLIFGFTVIWPKKNHHEALWNPDTLSDNNLSVLTEQHTHTLTHTHTAAMCAACEHLVAECQPPLNTWIGARTSTHAFSAFKVAAITISHQ